MGMCAEVIAIGPYSAAVAHLLDYPAERYAGTRDGSTVTRRLFGIEGSRLSREFATALGLTDPWDFNQHRLDPSRLDLPALQDFGSRHGDYLDEVDALMALLRQPGFDFHFRPEG